MSDMTVISTQRLNQLESIEAQQDEAVRKAKIEALNEAVNEINNNWAFIDGRFIISLNKVRIITNNLKSKIGE